MSATDKEKQADLIGALFDAAAVVIEKYEEIPMVRFSDLPEEQRAVLVPALLNVAAAVGYAVAQASGHV